MADLETAPGAVVAHKDRTGGAGSSEVAGVTAAASGGGGTRAAEAGDDADDKGSIIKPRPGTDPDLREACAIDLDRPKPSDPKAARVWTAGRRKRDLDVRRAQAQVDVDSAFTDLVAAKREERDARRLDAARRLEATGVDLDRLLALAAEGKLPAGLAQS